MKRINIFTIIALCLLIAVPANAQQRKKQRKNKAKKVVVEEVKTPADILFEEMLPSTAKVMFIDSMVVDKESFLKSIIINSEAGSLTESNGNITYTNEFGNIRYQTLGDTIKGFNISSSMLIGDKWSTPTKIASINSQFQNSCNPFMLSDGATLFFAAQGEKSIGGYDIFMTLYNNETATFYEPNNYGLPFNSKSNDYFLAIDEFSNIGWLVSDRYQPEDTVCIYIFEPTKSRKSYEGDDLSDEDLMSRATLQHISDTWSYGNRKQALARLKAIQAISGEDNKEQMNFIVNDNSVYSSTSQFKSATSKKLYQQLTELKSMLSDYEVTAEIMRRQYAQSTGSKKISLKEKILDIEKNILQATTDIKNTEKRIRQLEIN